MLVTGVGNDTEFGQIAQELSSIEKTTTPLQEKLDKLGKQITVLGASAAAIADVSALPWVSPEQMLQRKPVIWYFWMILSPQSSKRCSGDVEFMRISNVLFSSS